MMSPTSTRTRRFRGKKQSNRIVTHKLVCFTLNHEHFAIAVEHIQYILQEFVAYSPLENGCSLVRHHHDTIVLVDLSQLCLNRAAIEPENYLIVCQVNQQKIGIAVSHIPTILEVSDEQFSAIPTIYQQRFNAQVIEQLIQIPDRAPIFYLQPSALVEQQG